jgi:hypothetical protein
MENCSDDNHPKSSFTLKDTSQVCKHEQSNWIANIPQEAAKLSDTKL